MSDKAYSENIKNVTKRFTTRLFTTYLFHNIR